jgi:ketosteroid isomerase-like protein
MTSRRLMSAFLALMLALPAFAQNAVTAPAAEELTALLKEFLDGASRNDVAAHERFWADDLIYTSSSGQRTNKAEILDSLRASADADAAAAEPAEYSAEDIRIQQYGDTAVVAFRLVGRTGSGPQAVVEYFLNTGTFFKRDGEWRVVAWQATREAPQ